MRLGSKRRALVLALGLFLATLAALAPPVAAVEISQPAFANGDATVTVHFEDPDNLPVTSVLLHFSCSAEGDFTETLSLVEGDSSDHATLHIFSDSTTTGYGYFQGAQTGYGYYAGEHGYATGERAVLGGYGYDYGYGYGYGYGYNGGDLALTFDMHAAAFVADDVCTLVVGLDVPGIVGDYESPRSAPFSPRLAPIADAGANQTVPSKAKVALDGSASTDPDGLPEPLTYAWTQISGPAVVLEDNDTANPTFDAPACLPLDPLGVSCLVCEPLDPLCLELLGGSEAVLVFELTVYDGLDPASDLVAITVHDENEAPVADAGGNATVAEGAPAALDATGSSDPDGDTLHFSWQQASGPTVTLAGNDTATPTFTAPAVTADTPLVFTVTASDGVFSDQDNVTILVQDNDLPSVSLLADPATGDAPLAVVFTLAASDPDGSIASYQLDFDDGSQPLTGTGSPPATAAHTYVLPDTYAALLTVVDDRGASASATALVVATVEGNGVPVANAGADQGVLEGTLVQLDGLGSSDSEDDDSELAFEWTAPAAITLSGADTATPTFTAPQVSQPTPFVFGLRVTDTGGLTSLLDQVVVTVNDASASVSETYYLHTTGCTVVGLLGRDDSSTRANTAGDDELCVEPVVPLVANGDQSFPAQSPLVSFDEGSDVEGVVYLTFLVADEDADLPVLDGARVDVALRSAAGTIGEAENLRVDSPVLVVGLLSDAGLPIGSVAYVPVEFGFETERDLPAGTPFTFDLHVAPSANLAYMVGTEGDHASTFTLAGVGAGATNLAPTANAGPDQTSLEGASVQLDGSGSSDPESQALGFAWTQVAGPSVQLASANGATPTFTAPPVTADTALTFRLVVSDGLLTAADEVVVTVQDVADNVAPGADAGLDRSANEGTVVTLDGVATDANGNLDTVAWEQVVATGDPVVTLTQLAGHDASFTAPQVSASRALTFRLIATDTVGLTDDDTMVFTVLDVPAGNTGGGNEPLNGEDTGSGPGSGPAVPPPCTACTPTPTPTPTPSPTPKPTPTTAPVPGFPAPANGLFGYDLSSSLTVTQVDGVNHLEWDDPGFEPLGYQLWSSNSPYVLLAINDGDATSYDDPLGDEETAYKVTYFTGMTEEQGFFAEAAAFFGWTEAGHAPADVAETNGIPAVEGAWLALALLAAAAVVASRRR